MRSKFLRRQRLANVEAFFMRDELLASPDIHLVSVHKRGRPGTEALAAALIEHAQDAIELLRRVAKGDAEEVGFEAAELVARFDIARQT